MSFDSGFHVGGGLIGLAGFRAGVQAIDGDHGLLGQVQCLGEGIRFLPGDDIVGGQHDGSRALAFGVRFIGGTIGEAGQHGRAGDHAIADKRGGVLTVLRAFQPVRDFLILSV